MNDYAIFLEAIRRVETGGLPNNGRAAVGDDRKSIGPYQIQWRYFYDAIEGTGEQYRRCEEGRLSIAVMTGYFLRYCPTAFLEGDWGKCARVHNGGPNGWKKKCTVAYSERVLNEMKKIRSEFPLPGIRQTPFKWTVL